MKDQIQCPNCQSKKVRRISKATQVLFGIGVAMVGLGLLVVAVTGVVGYYLFSLPLLAVGGISAAKEHYNPIAKAHCHDCQKAFEYTLN